MKTTEHQTRVRPQPGATRCPYCHDDCAETEDVVACRACLSRHHSDCWAEAGECSSCSASEYLGAPETETETETETEESTVLGMEKGELALWVTLLATSGLILGMVQGVSAFEAMFTEVGLKLPWLTQAVLAPAKHPLLCAFGVVAWVATAALARKHRKAFVAVVVGGVLVSIPLVMIALSLPLITTLEAL